MPRLWQGDVGEPVLLLIIPTDFCLVGSLVYQMVDKLFGEEEAITQFSEAAVHPLLKTLRTISIVVLCADEDSWESVEYQIIIIRGVIYHEFRFKGFGNVA